MNRPSIFVVFVVAVALAIAPITACSKFEATPAGKYSAVAADIDLVVSGLKSLLPYILSATTATRYNSYIDQIASLGKAVADAQDANSAKSTVQQILAAAEAALSVVASIALPGVGGTVVAAIQVLLPIITAGVGLVGLRPIPPRGMSVEQARTILARRM